MCSLSSLGSTRSILVPRSTRTGDSPPDSLVLAPPVTASSCWNFLCAFTEFLVLKVRQRTSLWQKWEKEGSINSWRYLPGCFAVLTINIWIDSKPHSFATSRSRLSALLGYSFYFSTWLFVANLISVLIGVYCSCKIVCVAVFFLSMQSDNRHPPINSSLGKENKKTVSR